MYEQLKQYVIGRITFDKVEEPSERNFESQLVRELDTMGIYHKDCKAFYELDPQSVFEISRENGFEIDPSKDPLQQIDDISREAMTCLCYNHLYSELKAIYDEEQKLTKQEFLERDFEDNCELLRDELLSYEEMKEMIKNELDNDNIFMVLHLAKAIENQEEYYIYDRSMGTLETPREVKDNEDLLEVVDNWGVNILKEEE